ncbi:MAG: HAMP domain-containing histidine kinase [Muribaculaceae bacterium]|nr:HAMP domain-containing histidine kinase [Muribaculaceae bacterium]
MEKRIKTLYIITIASILAFLGMQVYWLYGRYEASLCEQEDRIFAAVQTEMEDYLNKNRELQSIVGFLSSYTLSTVRDSLGPRNYKAEIRWFDREDYNRFVGKDSTDSGNGKDKMEKAFWDECTPRIRKTYEASAAPSEGDVWTAMRKADIEFRVPMSTHRLDSIMSVVGLNVRSRIFVTDTIIWNYDLRRHSSMFNPEGTVGIPYSELEKKRAEVIFAIPAGDILNRMWGTLAVAVLLSCFLIVCLVFQISTVLKLSRLDKLRNGFITTMIHELKRPISTLKMSVSGLENERMMSEPAIKKEMLAETRLALDNLSAYFSKLRDITFNDVEQIPLNHQLINLKDIFGEVTDSIVIPIGKRAEFINDIDESLMVSADQTHLYNVLNNLVENAVKYSGDTVEIMAEASIGNGIVELRISDTGYGIPSYDLRHIFKRFYRGKASAGDQPGMGLGLAYVRLLVEAHGGEITVESTEGKGTCFIIKLPQ